MTFKLADYGTVFATRARGSRMLATVSEAPLVLDFSKVERISYSFADEFVGKLLQRIKDREGEAPTLLNMTEQVDDVVSLSLTNRNLTAPRSTRQLQPA